MADIKIKIKIQESGLNVIDEIIERVKKLNATLEPNQFVALQRGSEKVVESLEKVGDGIERIQESLSGTIDSIRNQSRDLRESPIARAAQQAGEGLETLVSRVAVFSASGILISQNFGAFMDIARDGLSALLPLVQDIGASFLQVGNILKTAVFANIKLVLSGVFQIVDVFNLASQGVISFIGLFSGVFRIASGLTTSLITFTAIRFFIGEIGILLGRITGRGQENLSILQRSARLIGLLDDGLNRSFKILGAISKLGLFSAISAFVNPVLGIPGVLNSVIDITGTLFRFVSTKFLAFFQSGRAQFTLILNDLRTLIRNTLPQILRLADSFIFVLRRVKTEQLDAIFSRLFGIQEKTRSIIDRFPEIRELLAKTGSLLNTLILTPLKKIGQIIISPFMLLPGLFRGIGNIARGLGGLLKPIFAGREDPLRRRTTIIRRGEVERAQQLSPAIDKAKVRTLEFADAAKNVTKNFATTRQQLQLILDLLFNVKLQGKKVSGSLFETGQISTVQSFVGSLVGISEGTKNIEQLNNITKKFLRTLEDVAIVTKQQPTEFINFLTKFRQEVEKGLLSVPRDLKRFRDELQRALIALGQDPQLSGEPGQQLGNKFFSALTRSFKEGKAVGQFRLAAKAIVNAFAELLPGEKFKNTGSKISKSLSEGINKEKARTDKAAEELAAGISDHFPQSPARKGPLSRLGRSGIEIGRILARGMRSGLSIVSRAAAAIAERISGYFPNSPALFGALVFLVPMGKAITTQLAAGIRQGFSLITSVMERFTQLIASPIAKINDNANLQRFSKRVGASVEEISALRGALQQVGGNANELNFIFSRFNKVLAEDNEEQIEKFSALGINLDEIRRSGKPSLSFFLSLSDSIQKFGIRSKEVQEVLTNLGITGTSTVLNLFQEDIRGLIKDTDRLGGVVSSSFAKNSEELNRLLNQFRQFRDFLLNNFLDPILPAIKERTQQIISLIKENSLEIRAFFAIVGDILLTVSDAIGQFVLLLVKDPRKALVLFFDTLRETFELIFTTTKKIFDLISEELLNFLSGIARLVFSFTSNLFSELLQISTPGGPVGLLLKRAGIQIAKFLIDITSDIFSAVGSLIINLPRIITEGIPQVFRQITSAIELQIQKFTIFLVRKFKESVKAIPGAEALLDAFGFSEVLDLSEKQLDQLQREVEDSASGSAKALDGFLKKSKEFIGDVVESAKSGVAPLIRFGVNIDEEYKSINKNIEESSKGINFSFKRVVEGLDKEIDSIKDSARRLGEKLADPEIFKKFKENLSGTLENMRAIFAEAGLEEEFKRISDSLSPENFQEKLEELRRRSQEIRSVLAGDQPTAVGPEQQEPIAGDEGGRRGFFSDLLNLRGTVQIDETGQKFLALGEKISEVWGGLGQVFQETFEASGRSLREFAILAKGINLTQAIINVATGVTQALANLPPPLSFLQAAAVSLRGGLQIGKIASQSFAEGGMVNQGTGPKSDDVIARVSRGEFVLPAASVQKYGVGMLEAMRQNIFPSFDFSPENMPRAIFSPNIPAFQEGGLVDPVDSNSFGLAEDIAVNNINVLDPSLLGQFLSSEPGRRTLLNILSDNSEELRGIVAT